MSAFDGIDALKGYNPSLFQLSEEADDKALEKQQNDDKKINNEESAYQQLHQQKESTSSNKKNIVYKYTLGDQIYESIIVGDYPVFFTINENRKLTLLDKIEERTRILKPPAIEEYLLVLSIYICRDKRKFMILQI